MSQAARTQNTAGEVQIRSGAAMLPGELIVSSDARGVVLFAHGSGSSRHSPRNQFVAHQFQQAALATLLFDLLTSREETEDLQTRALRFDIGLLARRTIGAIDWSRAAVNSSHVRALRRAPDRPLAG